MNKILTKLSIFVTSVIFMTPLFACAKKDTVDSNHVFTATETNKDLVLDGESEYKIILPSENASGLANARDELLRFFKEATGVKLTVGTDGGKTHNADQKYISLGDTSLLKSTKYYNPEIDLNKDGCRVVTLDNNIYIFGETNDGVLYGVYDFLDIYFNFEFYYTDCYTLDTGIKNLKLKHFDVTDIPDIRYRQRRGLFYPSSGDNDDIMFGYRSRNVDDMSSLLLPIYQGSEAKNVHNSFYFIPNTAENLEKHSEFFATSGQQLCYTARGDSEKFEEMVETCAAKVEESLIKNCDNKTYNSVGLFIEDNHMYCQCDACKECAKKHNNASVAPIIIFVKAMGKKVNEWMAKPENAKYARDLSYMFFAYQECLTVPFEDINNVPSDIAKEDGLKIMPYVALSDFDITRGLYDKSNDILRKEAELWGAYYEGAWAWSYGAFFNDYMSFFDCYTFYKDYNAFIKKNKYSVTFNQVQDYQRGGHSGFYNMASWALAKLSWNSSLDIFELCDEYLKAVFKEAYDPIRKLFDEFRLMFARWQLTYNFGESANGEIVSTQAKYFSTGLIRQFLALFEEAYTDIEIYRDMPGQYQKLVNYIDMEWLFIGKVIIDCGETLQGFTKEEINDAKVKFKQIVERIGIRAHREFKSISEYLNSIA